MVVVPFVTVGIYGLNGSGRTVDGLLRYGNREEILEV